MRFFVALEIPDQNKKQLQAVQQKLKRFLPAVHLTNFEKLHLTLAFIGEQPDALQKPLTQIIQTATSGISSFQITPAYLDGFPNIHNPRTIWIGVKGDIDKLLLIRERIKDGLVNLNLPLNERRFLPHIAIAKSTQLKITPDLEKKLQKLMTQPFNLVPISSIKLFESIPEHGFHRHNTLAVIKLTG